MTGFLSDTPLDLNTLEAAKQKRIAEGLPLIDLSSSNPTKHGFIFPPEILERLSGEFWGHRTYDPDPRGTLRAREAVCRYYSERSPSLDISPDQIFITASTSEAYSLLFTLLADPGDNLLAPDITYPLFDLLAESRQLGLKTYLIEESDRWSIDERSLRDSADQRSRAVLFVSPHNPTGHTLDCAIPVLSDLNLPVICDEVFAEFTDSSIAAPPFAAFCDDVPVFLLNGISKIFALPDLKLGWIVMNRKARDKYSARLEILNDCFLGASSLIQHMLPGIFESGRPFINSMVKTIRSNVSLVCDTLSAEGNFHVIRPSGGAFVFPRVSIEADEEDLVIALLNRGVYIHPGFFYGASQGVHLLISCLLERKLLQESLELIIKTVHEAA